jgi:hypothetical protein
MSCQRLYVESSDTGALVHRLHRRNIERHLDVMPRKLKPIFQKILEDTKARGEIAVLLHM